MDQPTTRIVEVASPSSSELGTAVREALRSSEDQVTRVAVGNTVLVIGRTRLDVTPAEIGAVEEESYPDTPSRIPEEYDTWLG